MASRSPQQLKLEPGAYIELIPVASLSLPPEDTIAAQATMGIGDRPTCFTYGEWQAKKRATLEAAYRSTIFRVRIDGGEHDIRVSQALPTAVAAVLSGQSTTKSGAFLTANNPGSRRLSQAENDRRNRQLAERLKRRQVEFHEGEGIDGEGKWPAEKSCLIAGIGRDEALRLAAEFGQYCFVYLEVGKGAELVYTKHWDDLWSDADRASCGEPRRSE